MNKDDPPQKEWDFSTNFCNEPESSALKAGARLYVISRIVVQMRPVREFSIKLSFTLYENYP